MKKVLIVDDEPDILLMLRVNLEAEGYVTALAADGDTALRRIREERPDLVLLDVMMPVVDGWGVLEALAGDAVTGPRVVVLSAKTGSRDVLRALALGAADYVSKPFDPDRLLDTVARVLSSSRGELDSHRRDVIERVGGRDPVTSASWASTTSSATSWSTRSEQVTSS